VISFLIAISLSFALHTTLQILGLL
jgi:hypothetical protein